MHTTLSTHAPARRARRDAPAPRSHARLRTTALIVAGAVAMLAVNAVASAVRHPVASLLVGGVLAVGMIALYVWAGIRFERRTVTEFARRGGLRHVLTGVAIGVGLAAATIGILALFGAYRITGWGSITGALVAAGTMIAVAVSEEVFFRGIVFRLLHSRWGAVIALIVSSGLFGLIHLLNPGATLAGALAVAVEAGLLLGSAYLLTGSLWLAIGLHFGWNVAIGGIFGAVVSGSAASGSGSSDSLVAATTAGPDWLTGGGFGPEASIVAVIVCVAATAGMLVTARRRGRI
ncbi:CPBP family glutamic-type intramembrane protease [Microbacterium sp. ARD32]|uniref:CPBP family glutamic-type intramembrane protease n=1 Tax=Microbacterium sp. ARD32 TaxID=2962577 RepID=UPI0028826545|nr:CPBP family glutamic-type intramembrane protease [Microbacterium sp. ARD32]MDT0158042.1 CPBP family glutamic-type intramembrane protease [Microbacterium sp. ARD32]